MASLTRMDGTRYQRAQRLPLGCSDESVTASFCLHHSFLHPGASPNPSGAVSKRKAPARPAGLHLTPGHWGGFTAGEQSGPTCSANPRIPQIL